MKVCGQSNDTVQHIYGLLKFRKSWKLPLFPHNAWSDFLGLLCSNARGHFQIFASLQLLCMCLCVCVCAHDLYICATGLVRLFATLNILRLLT